MGAGAKADPSRVQISDISQTLEDPLARAVRRRIRKMGIDTGITVVYSTEKPNIKLLPLDESQLNNADEYATLPDFRSRILPVLGTIPAIFGMAIATFAITEISGYQMQPLANKLRDKLYSRLHRDLCMRERNVHGQNNIPLSKHDVGYIFDEIWRGRCAVTGALDKLALVRWDSSKPLSFQNCVVMTKSEIKKHEQLVIGCPEDHYSAEIVEFVHSRFKEEQSISQFR